MYEEWLEENGYDPNKLYTLKELRTLNEDLLFEQATIDKEDSKLPYTIWLDPTGKDRGNKYSGSPRIKITLPGTEEQVPITISEDPEVPASVKKNKNIKIPKFNELKEWIIAYRKILLAHFYRQINDKQATSLLLSVDKASEAELKLGKYLGHKPKGYIEWFYDQSEGVYEAQVKDDEGQIVTRSIELSRHAMWTEIQELKNIYEVEDKNIKYLGEK